MPAQDLPLRPGGGYAFVRNRLCAWHYLLGADEKGPTDNDWPLFNSGISIHANAHGTANVPQPMRFGCKFLAMLWAACRRPSAQFSHLASCCPFQPLIWSPFGNRAEDRVAKLATTGTCSSSTTPPMEKTRSPLRFPLKRSQKGYPQSSHTHMLHIPPAIVCLIAHDTASLQWEVSKKPACNFNTRTPIPRAKGCNHPGQWFEGCSEGAMSWKSQPGLHFLA